MTNPKTDTSSDNKGSYKVCEPKILRERVICLNWCACHRTTVKTWHK